MRRCDAIPLILLFAVSASCARPPVKPGEKPKTAVASKAATKTVGKRAPVIVTQPSYEVDPQTHPRSSAALLAEGKKIYEQRCAACHGPSGKADGPAAYLLYPKPRDLVDAVYRFVSTWDGAPTDDDLFRAISRGVPGSAMPSWAHLAERSRWAVVHYIKTLASDPIEVSTDEEDGIIAVPPRPKANAASVAEGRKLFEAACVKCHGTLGQGDGPSAPTLVDSGQVPIRPRDLTTGVFKGPRKPEDLFRRISRGIPGTPMPAIGKDAGAWHLTNYVLSLSSEQGRELAEMRRYRIVATRVAVLPDHPDSGAWQDAPPFRLHLMPIWWRYNRPEYLTVRAMHDGTRFAMLLVWEDETNNSMVIRPQDFRDAAAVQFALTDDAPLFAMGQAGKFVNIWLWKSEREADLAGYHDLDEQYPSSGIDSYPNVEASKYEQPMREALTLKSNPTFVTGWGAGNIVSDPMRKSSSEDLSAEGFGTLRARPRADQKIGSRGVHSLGSYRVMFERSLAATGERSVELKPGSSVPVAFAIWNGAAADRDGKKSVTIWQDLVILD